MTVGLRTEEGHNEPAKGHDCRTACVDAIAEETMPCQYLTVIVAIMRLITLRSQ